MTKPTVFLNYVGADGGLREDVRKESPACPHCGSRRVVKAGKVKDKYVTKQGYKCKGCGRFFVGRDGFEGRTYPKDVILWALCLRGKGFPLAKIRDDICQHNGYKPADSTILDWVKRYSKTQEV
jgi:DNA-directed RNA polymerase subunit RPC12/RpoP